mgnify:CR=1 FL=1
MKMRFSGYYQLIFEIFLLTHFVAMGAAASFIGQFFASSLLRYLAFTLLIKWL